MLYSIRLETRNWDHKLIRNMFTELINEVRWGGIFPPTSTHTDVLKPVARGSAGGRMLDLDDFEAHWVVSEVLMNVVSLQSPTLRHFGPSDSLRTYENRTNNHMRPLTKLAPKRLR